jgi:hypothetical protein
MQSGWDDSRSYPFVPIRIGRSEYIHWNGEAGYDWYDLRAQFKDGYVFYWTAPFNLSEVSNIYLPGEEGGCTCVFQLGRWQPLG